MAFDGSGNFNRVHNWGQDAAAEIDIESARMDDEDNNFASGLSAVLVRDGQAPMLGNLNFGTFKGTNLGVPTAASDAVRKDYVDDNFVGNAGGVISGEGPLLGFQKTDELANVSRWHIGMSDSSFRIEPLQGDGSTGVDFGAVEFARDENGLVGATMPKTAISNDTDGTLLSLFSDAMPQILFDDDGVQSTITWDGPNTKFVMSGAADFGGAIAVTGGISATSDITTTGSAVSASKVAMNQNDGHGNANLTFNCADGIASVAGSAGRLRADTDGDAGGVRLELQDTIAAGGAWAPQTVWLAREGSFVVYKSTTIDDTLTTNGKINVTSGGLDVSGTTNLGTTNTGTLGVTGSITASSNITASGNVYGTTVYATNGYLYSRGATSTVQRHVTFQSSGGGTTYAQVGWSGGNGTVVADHISSRYLYMNGLAGSYRGAVFSVGTGAVALGGGMRVRAGYQGSWGSNRINFSWSSPDVSLWVDGSNQGTIFTSSDERFKDIIPGDFDALGVINQMTLKKYKWKEMAADEEKGFPGQRDDGKEYFGVMAQQVAELFPAAAYGDPSEMMKVPTAWDEEEIEVEEDDGKGKVKKVKKKVKGNPTAWSETDIPQKMGLHPLHLCNLLLGAVQQLSARIEVLEGS